MKKRILSLALAVVMVCAVLPTAVAAEGTVYTVTDEEAGLSFTLDGYLRTEKHVYPCWDWQIDEPSVVGMTLYVVEDGSQIRIEALPGWSYCDDDHSYRWERVDRSTQDDRKLVEYPREDGYYWDEEQQTFLMGGYGGAICYYMHGPETDTMTPDSAYFYRNCCVVSESYYNELVPLDPGAWTEVVPAKYDRAWHFDRGLAQVCLDGKWGFIDETGKEVIPCKYDGEIYFDQDLAAVSLDGKWGFIDATGKEVIPCQYDDAWDFDQGLARVKRDGKCGFIDTTGAEVIPCQYDDAGSFDQGLARVKRDGKWGFIDKTGTEVIPCTLAYTEVSNFYGDAAFVKILVDEWYDGEYIYWECKCGLIDKTGREILPCKYDELGLGSGFHFSEGLAAVSVDSGEKHEWGEPIYKWGFIDQTGTEVIPCQYDYAWDFDQGYAEVSKDGEQYYIDKTGRRVEVEPPQPGQSSQPEELEAPRGELAPAELFGKWGYVTMKDKTTPPEQPAPAAYTAKATNDKLTVDGVSKAPTAYKINNANYFQLRDVAVLLNSTKAQFSVDYDDAMKAIKITTGQPYAPNGKEMKGAKATAEAIVGNNDVYINGVKTDFAVYKIGGSNFFQIRDLGKALGFNVDWAKDVGIIIDPSKPYSGK